MKESKTAEQIADEILKRQNETLAKGRERLGPRKIGEHVIKVLKPGKELDVDLLLSSLAEEVNDPNSSDQALAQWAFDKVKELTNQPSD
ncbi:hypothetical protein [Zhongshania aliphaticivorans]|uniref:hypothetical protein n=1 Tax=Zhongshania aliphaticivorans TaxID=1470434 RepID=UPI0012E48372|nr:hypothetical protein [Zhongshania aliphaticivorans]CAA0103240.1 Uncharacterised protein [Zhongshania aliphaticivorans]